MGSIPGQDTFLSQHTSEIYLYSGVYDPSVVATYAVVGTLFLGTGGTAGGKLWQKQDDGLTTAWTLVAGGGGGGGNSVLFGAGVPAAGLGAVGDVYVDTTARTMYKKTAPLTWTLEITFSMVPTTDIYVDVNRVDAYTPTGAIDLPFKNIQAAVNKVIALGDNTAAKPYRIVSAPGSYPENVLLNSAALVSLVLDGQDGTIINPVAGNSIESSASNTNFTALNVKGLTCNRPVLFQGDIDQTNAFNFGLNFTNCLLQAGATFRNIVAWTILDGEVGGNVVTENTVSGGFDSCIAFVGDLISTWNGGGNKPNGEVAGDMFTVLQSTVQTGNVQVGLNTQVQFRVGSRCVNPGNTATVNGILILYTSHTRGFIVVNAGGELDVRGGTFEQANLTVNIGGVYTTLPLSAIEGYNPAIPGNWSPAPLFVNTALDQLAARPAGSPPLVPTVQKFLTPGSFTYTRPTPAPLYIVVEQVGGGGAGSGGAGPAGGAGGTTSFGAGILTCTGGAGGFSNGGVAAGGVATIGAGAVGDAVNGGGTDDGGLVNTGTASTPGADSFFAGRGDAAAIAGHAAATNSGSGGGGGGSGGGSASTGGAAGAYIKALITLVPASAPVVVGAGGVPPANGGAGGAGKIIVTEYYQ